MLFMYEITDRGKKEAEETKKVNSYFSLHADLATFRGSFIKWRPHICPHVLKVLLSPILRRPAVIFKCVRFAQPFTADHNLMVKGKKNKQTNKKQDAFTNVSALCTDWKKKKKPRITKNTKAPHYWSVASLYWWGNEKSLEGKTLERWVRESLPRCKWCYIGRETDSAAHGHSAACTQYSYLVHLCIGRKFRGGAPSWKYIILTLSSNRSQLFFYKLKWSNLVTRSTEVVQLLPWIAHLWDHKVYLDNCRRTKATLILVYFICKVDFGK